MGNIKLLADYYGRRAQEYEQIYNRDDPIRQKEQNDIATAMKKLLAKKRVLEIACGTGYWTKFIVEVVDYVVAMDISDDMLAIARQKGLPSYRVEFCQGNAYDLDPIKVIFNGGVANFWLSHIPKARIDEFLKGFHKKLSSGAIVFMADNVYVPKVGGELIKRPDSKDTFKLRELTDGSKYEVLKNYYDEEQLSYIFSPHGRDVKINIGKCFWWLSYLVK
ncbi:MAG: methyltransferase domain-containing protein [Planctomycetota bacterium]